MKWEMKSLKSRLDGAGIKGYSLFVGEEKQLRQSGWRGIKVYLKDGKGRLTVDPVVEGIYSRGNRRTIKPWMDVSYRESVRLEPDREGAEKMIQLTGEGLDAGLFSHIGNIIPPGGHLMVSYEDIDAIHRETLIGLYAGVPPAASPLGYLIYRAGFHYIKDWYLAEGGHEGPRKLWGEKALDDRGETDYQRKTKGDLEEFLQRSGESDHLHIHEAGRERAGMILRDMEKWEEPAKQGS